MGNIVAQIDDSLLTEIYQQSFNLDTGISTQRKKESKQYCRLGSLVCWTDVPMMNGSKQKYRNSDEDVGRKPGTN